MFYLKDIKKEDFKLEIKKSLFGGRNKLLIKSKVYLEQFKYFLDSLHNVDHVNLKVNQAIFAQLIKIVNVHGVPLESLPVHLNH